MIVSYGADVPAWLIDPFGRTILPFFLDRSFNQIVCVLGLDGFSKELQAIRTTNWDRNGGVLITASRGIEYWPAHLWQHPWSANLHGGYGIIARYNVDRLGSITFTPDNLIPSELTAQDIASNINFLLGWRFERWDEIEIQDNSGHHSFSITPKLVRVQ